MRLRLILFTFLILSCKEPSDRVAHSKRDAGNQVPTPGRPGPEVVNGTQSGGMEIVTPKRIWRLTPEQFVNATDNLFRRETLIGKKLTSDSPAQSGFGNEADVLKMDTAYISNIEEAVGATAREFQSDLEKQLDCGRITAIAQDAKCLPSFVSQFGARAFRRVLTEEEKASYLLLYSKLEKSVGANEAFLGIVEAMMRSPNFLFRSETGSGIAGRQSASSCRAGECPGLCLDQRTPR